MTDHPSTIRAGTNDAEGIDWDDHASIHRADDGDGVFDAFKGLHRGTMAQMVAMLRTLPEDERSSLVIQKAGDRKYSAAEAMALAEREDFPG